jgi:hypothetical protein
MAEFLDAKEEENIVYADDSNVWQTGNNVQEVVRKLAEKAALLVEYRRSVGLSMNLAKTQLLLSTHAGNVSEVTVEVDGNTIHPGNVIELLGVRYDRKLATTLHIKSLLAAVRQRASVVARLPNDLATQRPRLEHEDNASVIWSKIQVAFNDVARSITGARRPDHVTIKDLLDLAGIESANRMVVKAIAAQTWSCYHSDDGKDGAGTTSGLSCSPTTRRTRQRRPGRPGPGRSRSP